MVSFRGKLAKGLVKRGIGVSYDLVDTPYDAILVIGGTRNLPDLWRARRRGIRIVQRLDGMNWIHRHRRTGWLHFLRAEYGNIILSLIRARLANHIVYQSEFSRQWWERVYGKTRIPWQVVLNGVDLDQYSPNGPGTPPEDHVRILMIEGSFGGGYEIELETGIRMAEQLMIAFGRKIEVRVVGKVASELQQKWKEKTKIQLHFTEQVPPESIPELDRSAHVLFSAALDAPCPNSTIEAMACGLPVVAFDTGALPELINRDAGLVIPYGGNPWKLETPDIDGLVRATEEILRNQQQFRAGARRRAEGVFSLDKMVDGYIDAFEA
jgi:glycosyltransferase involved in cell wall biosynthesis